MALNLHSSILVRSDFGSALMSGTQKSGALELVTNDRFETISCENEHCAPASPRRQPTVYSPSRLAVTHLMGLS